MRGREGGVAQQDVQQRRALAHWERTVASASAAGAGTAPEVRSKRERLSALSHCRAARKKGGSDAGLLSGSAALRIGRWAARRFGCGSAAGLLGSSPAARLLQQVTGRDRRRTGGEEPGQAAWGLGRVPARSAWGWGRRRAAGTSSAQGGVGSGTSGTRASTGWGSGARPDGWRTGVDRPGQRGAGTAAWRAAWGRGRRRTAGTGGAQGRRGAGTGGAQASTGRGSGARPGRAETSPALLWTGKVGDASAFRFYHPTSRRVLSSQDVTIDESVPYYRLFPYRTPSLPRPPLFLVPGPPLVDPLPPQGPAPSGVSQVDAVEPVEVTGDSGAAEGAEPRGAETGGVLSLGVLSLGVLRMGVLEVLELLEVLLERVLLLGVLSRDSLRAASPTVTRLLATVVTDPCFESSAASALVTELVDFAAHCRLDYAASLVAESASVCPQSVGGECALGTDVLDDRQEKFQ
ncbi:unnamed protein product, partial [Closterium sp. NIES-65]